MAKTKMTKIIASLVLIIMVMTLFVVPVNANVIFSDLSPMHWCYDKIIDFEEKGYVCGYEDGTFRADRTITRAEYVKIVNNFFGYELEYDNEAEFSDVSSGDWFAPYVNEAAERGYIEGYGDGTFKPHDPIRRQEATVILSRILGIDEEEYPDNHKDGLAQYSDGDEVQEWARVAIHSYSVYNFINGYEDGTLRILQDVTRAETVELLHILEQKVVIDRPNGGKSESAVRNAYYYNSGEEIVAYRTEVKYGRSTLVKAMGIENPGYDFAGWQLRGTETIYQPGESTEYVTEDIFFDAVWSPIYYDINYDVQGGSGEPSGEEIRWNNEYTISNLIPMKEGFDFVGWGVDGETKVYMPGEVIPNVLKDYEFKALWTKLETKVENDNTDDVPESGDSSTSGDQGSDDEDGDYKLIADSITLVIGDVEELIAELNPTYSETEYEWTVVKGENRDKNIALTKDGELSALKATDEPVKIMVTATTNEGVEITKTLEVTVLPIKVTIHHDFPDESGELLDYSSGDFELTSINDKIRVLHYKDKSKWYDAEVTDGDEIITHESDSYESTITYTRLLATITFKANDGTNDEEEQKIKVGATEALDTNPFDRDGYDYIGWNTKANGKGTSYADEALWEGKEDVTLYAQWEALDNTLTFEYNGATSGSGETERTVKTDAPLGKLPAPEKTYYDFEGWYKENDEFTTEVTSSTKMPPEDMTIYAKWLWNPEIEATLKSKQSNAVGKRAEPGTEITYTLTINNKEDGPLDLQLPFDDDVTIEYDNQDGRITVPKGETTITLKATVPSSHNVATDFVLSGDIGIYNPDDEIGKSGDTVKATNNIEKTITVFDKEPTDKNIVIALDLSGSMAYCFNHDGGTTFRYHKDLVGTTDAKVKEFFFMETKEEKTMTLSGDYYYTHYAYQGHEYLGDDGKYHKCNDGTGGKTRLDVAKAGMIQLVKDLYEANEKLNAENAKTELRIVLVPFSTKALDPITLTSSNYATKINELKADYNTGVYSAINKSIDVIEELDKKGGDNYFIFFGDGNRSKDDDPDFSKDVFKALFDYTYAIGLGSAFDEGGIGYATLSEFVHEPDEDITVAKTPAGVAKAFEDITANIINVKQSVQGMVEVSVADRTYLPVRVEDADGILFTITSYVEGPVTWDDGITTTDVIATDEVLKIDFTGPNFSEKQGLKVTLIAQ